MSHFKLKCTKFDSWRLSVCILGGVTHRRIERHDERTLFMLLIEPSSHLQRSQYKPLNKQHSFLCTRLLNRMSQCRRPKGDNPKFGEILKTVHNWRPEKITFQTTQIDSRHLHRVGRGWNGSIHEFDWIFRELSGLECVFGWDDSDPVFN